jgi:hypothetical protein
VAPTRRCPRRNGESNGSAEQQANSGQVSLKMLCWPATGRLGQGADLLRAQPKLHECAHRRTDNNAQCQREEKPPSTESLWTRHISQTPHWTVTLRRVARYCLDGPFDNRDPMLANGLIVRAWSRLTIADTVGPLPR